MNPRRKARKEEQLTGELSGDLATCEKFGLFQRAITRRTAYRYRGVLLLYQKFLAGDTPSLEASKIFLAHLREQGYSPSTLRIYRAALKGFHEWRGENLVFPIKVPRHLAPYIEADVVARVLDLARENPRDHLALRLMSDAGLRREEVVYLQVKDISGNTIRIRGKGDKDRTVPMTSELAEAIKPVTQYMKPHDRVIGVAETAIYRMVRKYGNLAGKPDLKPHDLRHAFATRLLERGVPLRMVQELMGHSSVDTTQTYMAVTGRHLEEAINSLNKPPAVKLTEEQLLKVMDLLQKISERNHESPDDAAAGISPIVY